MNMQNMNENYTVFGERSINMPPSENVSTSLTFEPETFETYQFVERVHACTDKHT